MCCIRRRRNFAIGTAPGGLPWRFVTEVLFNGPVFHWQATYRAWRTSPLLQRTTRCWATLRGWMQENFQEVADSLVPGILLYLSKYVLYGSSPSGVYLVNALMYGAILVRKIQADNFMSALLVFCHFYLR